MSPNRTEASTTPISRSNAIDRSAVDQVLVEQAFGMLRFDSPRTEAVTITPPPAATDAPATSNSLAKSRPISTSHSVATLNPAATPPRPPLLRIEGLAKRFGTTVAVRDVSLTLAPGERLALLGPNGAGKTTLIRCLSGRCRPGGGRILIDDAPVPPGVTHPSLGLVPQDIAIYGDLTTLENLMAFGRFHGLRRRTLKQRVDWALQWTGLANRQHDLVGGFSGGMKRRVNIACGVLHEPRILLLDEPTVGVDPQSRHKIFEMLDELSSRGTAIVLTTHHLDEAESRCDRIVIVDHGSVVADGTIGQLLDQTVGASRMVAITLDRPLRERLTAESNPNPFGGTTSALDQTSPTVLGEVGDSILRTRIDHVATGLPRLLAAVHRSGYEVTDVEVISPSLHHVFLHLTGHELRDD